jgi:hypothetical protein
MMYKVATGPLKWTPREFWKSTPHDLWATIEANEEAAARLEEMRQRDG